MIIENFGYFDKEKIISLMKRRYDSAGTSIIDRGKACHYIGGYIAAISGFVDMAEAKCLHQEVQAYVSQGLAPPDKENDGD